MHSDFAERSSNKCSERQEIFTVFQERGTPFQKNILICGIYSDMLAAMRNLVGSGFMFRVDIGPSVVLVLFAWRQSH